MTEAIHFLILGLGTGALYALSGQGLVLIYRGSGVVNFAQGAIGMVAAFLFYALRDDHGVPALAAMAISVGAAVLIGVAIHLLIMRQLRRSSPLVRLVSTLGVFAFLVALGTQVWGPNSKFVVSPIPSATMHLFAKSIIFTEDRIWLLGLAVVVTAVLSVMSKRTPFGRATEAVAENPVAAGSLGLSPDVIAAANWGLGSGLVAVAAILVAPILVLSVAALSFTVLRGLAAALVGGFRSFWLTLGGALVIGMGESVLGRYMSEQPGVSRSAAFLVIVLVLVLRGRALPLRRELLDRLPSLGSGRIAVRPLVAALAALVVVLVTVPDDWVAAVTISMTFAVICLSLVLLTGYVGQLSLAQYALAGFGAWAAGRFAATTGAPFLLAAVVGVACTVPLGVIVALPALRTRGVNLAVITFGLSTMVYEIILNDARHTGGLQGTTVDPIHIFGLNVDAYSHPQRYALVVLVALVAVSLMVANIRRGRTGRRLVAVRSNERAAAALGVSVYGAKLYAFGVAAGIAALGGVLLSFRQRSMVFSDFDSFGSVQVVVFAVLGGIGYVLGAVFGALLAFGGVGARITKALGFGPGWLDVVAGAGLILMVLTNPDGMAKSNIESVHRVRDRLRRGRPRAAVETPLPDVELVVVEPIGLEVEDLTVRYGGVVALDNVSLVVRPGEVVGLIGPNGAGKTTFIDAVTGFTRPREGAVRVGGVNVDGWSAHRRSRAGLGRSFQSLELFEDLTVRENIQAACDSRAASIYFSDLVHPGHQALSSAAVAAVREFDLAGDLERFPSELPNGRRRLVAIARAIAAEPSILLLDEPAAGLSPAETADLGTLVVRLAREWGLSVLLIEHDVGLVMRVCDRIVALDFGRKICEGTPEDLANDPVLVAAYLGEPHQLEDAVTP